MLEAGPRPSSRHQPTWDGQVRTPRVCLAVRTRRSRPPPHREAILNFQVCYPHRTATATETRRTGFLVRPAPARLTDTKPLRRGRAVLIAKKSAGEIGASAHRISPYGTLSARPAIPPESTSAGVRGNRPGIFPLLDSARRCSRRVAGAGSAEAPVRYLKMSKCPSSHQSTRNMTTVPKQPPPSFLAPQPAAKPRRSLLMVHILSLSERPRFYSPRPESTSAGVARASLTGPAPARLTDPKPLRRGRWSSSESRLSAKATATRPTSTYLTCARPPG